MTEDQLYNIIGRLTADLITCQARIRDLEARLAAATIKPPDAAEKQS